MRFSVLIVFVFCLALTAHAQQIGLFSHYFYKPMIYNPALTGVGEGIDAMLINRTQWTGIKGGPQLNLFTLDGKFDDKKAAMGVTLISDRKGITRRVGGNVSYAYYLKFNEETFLTLGVAVGAIDHSIDFSKALIENISDPTLFITEQRRTVFDANAGLGFIWKGLEFGFAVPQLVQNKVNYVENTNVRAYYTQARHFMTSLKYRIDFSEEKRISLAPQMLMRIVPGAPLQFDGNLNFAWRDKFWLGGTYKSNYAIGINAGITLHRQFSIGYSYDVITGSIGAYSGISHEMMVSYRFGRSSKRDLDTTAYAAQRQVDSLAAVVSELQNKNTEIERDKLTSGQKIDSLQSALAAERSRIKELENKVTQINATGGSYNSGQSGNNNQSANTNTGNNNQNQGNNSTNYTSNNSSNNSGNNNSNQNQSFISQSAGKTMENDVWVITNTASDYKNAANTSLKKSVYVVGGTFFYRDFAENEVKRFKGQGFKSAGRIYSPLLDLNYVYLYKVNSKEEAFAKINSAKAAGINDAWILVLTE